MLNSIQQTLIRKANAIPLSALAKSVEAGEYDFLETDPHLGKRIIMLGLGGSHAYGTNVNGSDIDVRGCTMQSAVELLGMSNFEQVVREDTDTTIYGFNKLIQLLYNCNPNVIEILGLKPEHYLYLTEEGKTLIDNRHMFLSRKAINAFGGYATQQLRRLENALARDAMPQAQTERHILGSIKSAMQAFPERYQGFGADDYIRPYLAPSQKESMDQEIMLDVHLSNYPARDFSAMVNDLTNIIRDYSKLNKRNHKKDAAHLNKHAMHLLRLYYMCLDILEKEEIVTYREAEHDLLMSVRNGAFMTEDGLLRNEFFDILRGLEERLEYAKQNTSLPKTPDYKAIEAFMIEVNKKVL